MKTGIGIPCMFRMITGLKCPGCGITHMCICLMQLDFYGAWQSNPALMCIFPFAAVIAVVMLVRYIQTGTKKLPRWCNIILGIMIGILLIYGVLRNLPRFMY